MYDTISYHAYRTLDHNIGNYCDPYSPNLGTPHVIPPMPGTPAAKAAEGASSCMHVRITLSRTLGFGGYPYLKDQYILKSQKGIWTIDPFNCHFVLKVSAETSPTCPTLPAEACTQRFGSEVLETQVFSISW